MSLVFKRNADVMFGEAADFSGHVLPPDTHRPMAGAVLMIRTGAAEITLYPSPATLDALAENLRDLASAVRALREDVAA